MKKIITVFIFAVIFNLIARDINVKNEGTPGNNTNDALRRIDKVLAQKPDYLIICLGINDALNSSKLIAPKQYEANLKLIIEKAKEKGTQEIILFNLPPVIEKYVKKRHPLLSEKTPNLIIDEYNMIIKKLADTYKIPLADIHGFIEKNGNATEEKSSLIRNIANSDAEDGIHLTENGYFQMARLVYKLLKDKAINGNIVCFGDSVTYGSHMDGVGTASGCTYPGVLKRLLQQKNREPYFVSGVDEINIKSLGARGNGITDDTDTIQKIIDTYLPQYTNDKIQDHYATAVYPTLRIPAGRYLITKTLDLSFRNDLKIICDGEIFYDGPLDGTVIEAKCSSRFYVDGLKIDGQHKAGRFIHISGNGTSDGNTDSKNKCKGKGNVAGIRIQNCKFQNQNKYSEHAIFDTIPYSEDTKESWYYSMDDSSFDNCIFSSYGTKNFAVSLSSSENSFTCCNFYTPNGIFMKGGSTAKFYKCVFSIMRCNYKGAVYVAPDSHIGEISFFGCYLESSSQPLVNVDETSKYGRVFINIFGGLFAQLPNTKFFIYIPETVTGTINAYAPRFQSKVGKISNPSGSIYMNKLTDSPRTGDFMVETEAKQVVTITGIAEKDLIFESSANGSCAEFTIGEEENINEFKYKSLDNLLTTVGFSRGSTIKINLTQDSEITRSHTLRANINIQLNGKKLSIGNSINLYGGAILTIQNGSLHFDKSASVVNNGSYLYISESKINKIFPGYVIHHIAGTTCIINSESTADEMMEAGNETANGQILIRNLKVKDINAFISINKNNFVNSIYK